MASILAVLLSAPTSVKVSWALAEPTLGEMSCRVDMDCVLVSHPCEGKEAVNKELKATAEKRILENSKKSSCPQVSYYAHVQKTKATYKAVCVNRVCQTKQVSK
ncbi:hypothetical protein [Bdellovibrio sp. HCB209]|uniref:hypothetical protein n=1 Tax=Bdellovibrio sp. HCB209 TaxID=3394354 RepID=UPI0039B3D071